MNRFRVLLSILVAALVGCDLFDENASSPTSPAVADALVVTATGDSLPADGSSTMDIEAQVRPEATVRKLRFKTSRGTFVGADQDSTDKRTKTVTVDFRGFARVQLMSGTTVGRATVSVEALEETTSNGNVTVKVVAVRTIDVEFVAPSAETLEIVASSSSLPADGFSNVEITAKIAADSPPGRRTILFEATRGTLSEMEVEADLDGVATTRLQSEKTVTTSRVTARVKGLEETVFKSVLIDFVPVDPNEILRLSTSANEAPADGETLTQVFADVAPALPEGRREVMFTTSQGSFVGGEGPDAQAINASADSSHRATVRLKSGREAVDAILTAELEGVTVETTLALVPAPPDDLQIVPAKREFSRGTDREMTVTVNLSRTIGFVTAGTVVDYEIVMDDAARTPIAGMSFRAVTTSNQDQASTAILVAGSSEHEGSAILRASVERPGQTTLVKEEAIAVNP